MLSLFLRIFASLCNLIRCLCTRRFQLGLGVCPLRIDLFLGGTPRGL